MYGFTIHCQLDIEADCCLQRNPQPHIIRINCIADIAPPPIIFVSKCLEKQPFRMYNTTPIAYNHDQNSHFPPAHLKSNGNSCFKQPRARKNWKKSRHMIFSVISLLFAVEKVRQYWGTWGSHFPISCCQVHHPHLTEIPRERRPPPQSPPPQRAVSQRTSALSATHYTKLWAWKLRKKAAVK